MLINLIDELKIRTIFFGPTPRFREGLYAICQKEWFRPDFAIKEECSPYPREKILNDLEFYSIFLDKLTKESENIFILNAFDILCPEEYIYCPLKKDNQYIYSDEHHLTEFGSFLLENEVNNFLGSK